MLALNVSSCSETDAILDEICNNGKDDDGDGFIDSEDNDCTETGTECSNGKDDDGDGFIDGDDLDCTETGTECSNAIDDDGDGFTDGDDLDCTETGSECSNGKDDDGDGFTDGDDLDCTETGTECSNGKDDDGDGFTDCDDVDCNGNPNCQAVIGEQISKEEPAELISNSLLQQNNKLLLPFIRGDGPVPITIGMSGPEGLNLPLTYTNGNVLSKLSKVPSSNLAGNGLAKELFGHYWLCFTTLVIIRSVPIYIAIRRTNISCQ